MSVTYKYYLLNLHVAKNPELLATADTIEEAVRLLNDYPFKPTIMTPVSWRTKITDITNAPNVSKTLEESKIEGVADAV